MSEKTSEKRKEININKRESREFLKMKEDPRTMDIINPELKGMPERDYHEELNIRSHCAGYTTRKGGPIPLKIQNRGFGVSKLNVWPRDENGNLIGD